MHHQAQSLVNEIVADEPVRSAIRGAVRMCTTVDNRMNPGKTTVVGKSTKG